MSMWVETCLLQWKAFMTGHPSSQLQMIGKVCMVETWDLHP